MDELKNLKKKIALEPKLFISECAQVVTPWHIMFDRLEEERLGINSFGSNKSGIAPFYSDKYYKTGIQVCDLYNTETLKEKIYRICEVKNILLEHLYHVAPFNPDVVFEELLSHGDKIRHMVCDTTALLDKAIKRGKDILLEGQLGALKDPDLGIYPFTTSSSPLAGWVGLML